MNAAPDATNAKHKRHRGENIVPDYEHLFTEDKRAPKHKSGILYKLYKLNQKKLLLALLMYISQASPVDYAGCNRKNYKHCLQALRPSTLLCRHLYGVVVIVLLQNVPTHIIYAKMINTVMRKINALKWLCEKASRLSITYHKEIESGKIQSKFLRDIESIDGMIRNINNLVPAIIGVLISVGISTFNAPVMTLFFWQSCR